MNILELTFCVLLERPLRMSSVHNLGKLVEGYLAFCATQQAGDAVFVDWNPVREHFNRILPE